MDAGTLELVELDQSILDEQCRCEFRHSNIPCTEKVTHKLVSCAEGVLACDAATARARDVMGTPTALCGGCYKPTSSCWKVVPV